MSPMTNESSTPNGSETCSRFPENPSMSNMTIYNVLQENIKHNIVTISSGTLPGSIIILLAIDYVPRVTWMGWMFATLAGLFAINGGTFFVVFERGAFGIPSEPTFRFTRESHDPAPEEISQSTPPARPSMPFTWNYRSSFAKGKSSTRPTSLMADLAFIPV